MSLINFADDVKVGVVPVQSLKGLSVVVVCVGLWVWLSNILCLYVSYMLY